MFGAFLPSCVFFCIRHYYIPFFFSEARMRNTIYQCCLRNGFGPISLILLYATTLRMTVVNKFKKNGKKRKWSGAHRREKKNPKTKASQRQKLKEKGHNHRSGTMFRQFFDIKIVYHSTQRDHPAFMPTQINSLFCGVLASVRISKYFSFLARSSETMQFFRKGKTVSGSSLRSHRLTRVPFSRVEENMNEDKHK